MYIQPVMLLMGLMLFMSTLMALTSSNWFFIWMSMELNMLSFIPFMLSKSNSMELEGAVKYFITQSMASSCMLMCAMMLWVFSLFYSTIIKHLLVFSMLMKLGSFPCHFWFPVVMSSCNWMMCIMLSTWQKIIPIFILFSMLNLNNNLLMFISMFNMIIGGMFGMKSTNMKSIMGYSSISHMGWMLILKLPGMMISLYMYFIIYVIMILPMFLTMNKMNMWNFTNMKSMNKQPFNIMVLLCLMMLSMAGLPPFTGFVLKLMIMYNMISLSLPFMLIVTIISILSLYFYLNLSYNMLMSNYMNKDKMNNYKYHKKIGIKFPIMSMLLLTPVIFMMYAMTLFN